MNVRQLIRPGIAASATAHLSALALILLFGEVHPFSAVTADPITVDLVTPQEAVQAPPSAQPGPAAPTPPDKPSPPSPAMRGPGQEPHQAAAHPQSAPPARAASPSPSASTRPSGPPVEPDVTVKYHVALGLPDAQAPGSPSDGGSGEGIDATTAGAADLDSSVVAAFRKHLKTCSRLPASISTSDNIVVKLRVLMTPQALLAAEPVLVEGTASMKGVELKKSAVEALAACQPYNMLPADRFEEWRVLDLSFTPKDFV